MLMLSSPAFDNQEQIPVRYTCKGEGISPPLAISGTPDGANSLVLTLVDPDAPGGTFVHWILYDMPPDLGSIDEGLTPSNAFVGKNSMGNEEYIGPCPPNGTHRYIFTLYALDSLRGEDAGLTLDELSQAMEPHVLAQAQLIGLFGA